MEMMVSEYIRSEKGFLGDAVGGVETGRIDLDKCNRIRFEVQLASGVGTTAAVQLRQHDAASGGNSADLSSLKLYAKTDADAAFSEVTDLSSVDTAAGSVLVEVYKEDVLDGYTHVSLQVADPGAARVVCVTADLEAKFRPAHSVEL